MIINLTQHQATPAQLSAGVVELSVELRQQIVSTLTFTSLPSSEEVNLRAAMLAEIMKSIDIFHKDADLAFMVGGAPYLMSAMQKYTPAYNMLFAYSERVSEETIDPDGSVRKTNIFKHLGFVPMEHIEPKSLFI